MMLDAVRSCATSRRGMALLLALAMLLPAAQASVAQDATSETDIDIVVRPSDDRPGGSDGEGNGSGNGGGSQGEGLVDGGTSPVMLLPGTVSARYALVRENELTENGDDIVIIIVVRDDRGTAAGWDLGARYLSGSGTSAMPVLVENRDSTIRRVLPEDGRLSDQVNQVRGGRTLGMFDPSISFLHAMAGSGSGVYLQQVVALAPPLDAAAEPGTILIQLPFAP